MGGVFELEGNCCGEAPESGADDHDFQDHLVCNGKVYATADGYTMLDLACYDVVSNTMT